MSPLTSQPIVLITVSGPDQPGITASLTGILAESNATILDIGQAVIHGLLSLSILFKLDAQDKEKRSTIKDLLFKATELGLKLDFRVLEAKEDSIPKTPPFRYAITLIGETITAQALHQVTESLAKFAVNIDVIQRLSESEISCVELITSSTRPIDRSELKKNLLKTAGTLGVDIAVQSEGLFRRVKRLVVLDMDSTLIQNEVIDEFAREKGVLEQVASITREAMHGKLDFDQSLKRRCELLKGLKKSQIESVMDRIKLTPGAGELIRSLRKLGYRIALISGGFSVVADRFKEQLGLDYAYANQMEFHNSEFTGKIQSPIVNAQRKADLLDVICQQERIQLDQVIAIGDGANDILMLEKAGLGIAFNAKPIVSEKADLSLNQKNLHAILYLLGMSGKDLQDALNS